MRTTVAAFLCVALVPACCSATASGGGRTKDFPEYRCRLTLPGPGYQWLDHTQIPGSLGFIGNTSGTINLVLVAEPNPEGVSINERFAKGFDSGFSEDGRGSKIAGRIGSFRGVPCYEMHAKIRGLDAPATIRVFAANRYILQLQLLGNDPALSERDKLEPIFSAFEFIGEPELPVLSPELEKREIARSAAKYKFIALISIVVVAVVILLIRDAARRRRERRSSR